MKRNIIVSLVLAGVAVLTLGAEGKQPKFGDTKFISYEGPHNWPTAESAQVIKDHAIPIYVGLPPKPYKILGRIYDDRGRGIGVVGRAFAEGLFSEKNRQRDCANQAKHRGADAVVVTANEKVINAFGLTSKDLEKTTPLFDHKDKVTVAIKFAQE